MLVDLHNHTTLCNHAQGNMSEYIEKAIENKTKYFGFSDHGPMDFDTKYRMTMEQTTIYEQQVRELKEQYKDQINIFLGYEVDFLNGYMKEEIIDKKVDFLIGSVHFINKWGFDNPEFIGEYKNKDIDEIWQQYFNAIEEMAKIGKFDIVGHLDLIKIFKFFPKKDIRSIATLAIKAIKKANMVVEINTAGFRKEVSEQYPSKDLLELIYENNIEITFGSDGHTPEQVGLNAQKAIKLAKDIGFTKCVYFENREKNRIEF
jgi:histidinol-phosphatase (PHP family)